MKRSIFLFFFFLSTLSVSILCAEEADYTQENAIFVCENSLEMLDWDIDFIRHAEQSIELSACYCGGTVFQRIFAAVEERLKERPNLQFYFLASPIFFDAKDKEILNRFEKKYSKNFHPQMTTSVIVYKPDLMATDNHVKSLIVDELYFSVGGTNFDEVLCSDGKYTPPRNPERESAGLSLPGGPAGVRDQDVVGRGPIAKELRVNFHQLFALWEDYFHKNKLERDPAAFKDKNYYFPLDPTASRAFVEDFESSDDLIPTTQLKMILCGSMHSPNHITQEYEKLIKGAKKEIFIGNLYFCPVDSLMQTLMDAANRGVELKVITNGVGRKAPDYTKYFAWANRIFYVPMFYGREFHLWQGSTAAKAPLRKTRIFEYNIFDIVYHKKVMVVDKRYTIIGSYNLGMRSDSADFELVLVIDSEEIARRALKVLETDQTLSEEVSAQEARSWYFDPAISYLGNQQKKLQSIQ